MKSFTAALKAFLSGNVPQWPAKFNRVPDVMVCELPQVLSAIDEFENNWQKESDTGSPGLLCHAELDEWKKLRDPSTLHVSLLRGFPAKLTTDQLIHLIGSAEIENLFNKWLPIETLNHEEWVILGADDISFEGCKHGVRYRDTCGDYVRPTHWQPLPAGPGK